MTHKPLALATIALAISALSVVLTADGRPLNQGQIPLDRGEMVNPAPRNKDEGGVYSNLVWFEGVVRYDGFENISVRRDQLPAFTIGSNTWVIHVTEDRVDISWKQDPSTNVFITEGDFVLDDSEHPADNTY